MKENKNKKDLFEKMLNGILCGDSYKIIKDIPDKSIDLVVIDPPYEWNRNEAGDFLEKTILRKENIKMK